MITRPITLLDGTRLGQRSTDDLKKRDRCFHTIYDCIDYARSCRKKLFIIFIDYRKAYDLTPSERLLNSLSALGCGYAMTLAIATLYSDTRLILGSAVVTATLGLRQGSPTSCLLFTLYLNPFIKRMKESYGHDGFLEWLHVLLFMDDAVILANSRQAASKKLSVLEDFCATSGMVVNAGKTKFMVINGNAEDKVTFNSVEGLTVENCEKYVYLGSAFTQDGSSISS